MVDLKQPRLSGLGRNPAAPVDVLMRLAMHGAGRHGLETRKGQLPDAVVEALLTHGGRDSAVLLHGDRISPAMRHRIAGHPDPAIRDAHADFIRTMVECGVSTGIENLVEAYGRPPAELAAASDPKLRAIVAEAWRDRPTTVQLALLTDPDPGVRAAATRAKHPGVPPELYARCLADPAVQANVARYLPLTSDQFVRLLKAEDKTVLHAVARNPHLTADMVVQLQDCADPSVRFAVAFSRHVTAETRDRLLALVEAEKAAGGVDARVALDWPSYEPDWLRDAPLAERLSYLDCPHAVMRRVLADGRDLPDEAWQRLDDDPDVSVRRAAARRPGTPPQVLVRLLRAHGDVLHIRPLLVDHPNFPRQALRGFADEPDPRVRVFALEDPELPVSVLRRFADFEEGFLRAGAARHPNVTAELLERLMADPEPKVADEAAANSVLPRARMDRILAEAGL
ncbi:hypothetical protein SAMN06272735_8090 [Streptomyces sp. TLI_55]|uniref:hypothetical protein n=1 Tax=Streptomyces sp. TLI_55 TaxID=1938861 RepID=UPI000BD4C54A|nr:hypothetical protein [Streptomyces sp. TLI_55]SNX66242.1 hypothetical protein SAMN06272735_8090 [Streptomyces sp. TLI_55]